MIPEHSVKGSPNMDAKNALLDKARATCSRPSDLALAEKLGVSRSSVSHWRSGKEPLSDERIAQLAKLANEPGGKWLVAIRAQQTTGEAHRAWEQLARQLGMAASVAMMLGAGLTSWNIDILPIM